MKAIGQNGLAKNRPPSRNCWRYSALDRDEQLKIWRVDNKVGNVRNTGGIDSAACGTVAVKYREDRPLADSDAATRKLVEIANATEAVQDGRIYIERVNGAFLEAGGTPDQYRAALARAIKLGWLWLL
jgi:hypothetical protein